MSERTKDMFLYWGAGSGPCIAVMFVLAEKGMLKDCPQKMINFAKMEHKAEEVLKLNPRGQLDYSNNMESYYSLPGFGVAQVPAFKDGDVVLNDTWAICMYIEEKYGSEGTVLLPKDTDKRAAVYQRLFELMNVDSTLRPVFTYLMRNKEEDRDKVQYKELTDKAEEELARWNTYLTGNTYLCGEFSLADIFLYTATATIDRQGGVFDKYPALKAFHENVAKRPAAVESSPPDWKDGTPSPNVLKGFGQ